MKRKRIAIVSTAMLLSVGLLMGTAFAVSDSAKESENAPQDLYEKPEIGSLVNDGAYPDALSSSTSANAAVKEWYEYITYSAEPVNQEPIYVEDNKRVYYYDPFDYSYGLVMETSANLSELEGKETAFSSANTVKYTIKTVNSVEAVIGADYKYEDSITAEVKATAGAGVKDLYWAEVGSTITTKLSNTLDINVTVTNFSETTTSEEKTFQAVHFNSQGVPYQWRVVSYVVYLPLKCDVQILKDGEWISTGEDTYCLLATVQGTCRQFIENEVVKVEHWGTGEAVTVDDFWSGFLDKDSLIDAYKNKLLPQ